MTITSQEVYVKLTVSSLDYTKEGVCRVILSKALTATSEVSCTLRILQLLVVVCSAILKRMFFTLANDFKSVKGSILGCKPCSHNGSEHGIFYRLAQQ